VGRFNLGPPFGSMMVGVRVAFLAPLVAPLAEPHLGGVQTHLIDLARGLLGRGHLITVYASTGSRVSGTVIVDTGVDAELLQSSLFRPDREHTGDRDADRAFATAVALIAAGHHDVVHNHAFDVAAVRHTAALPVPVVHTLHLPADPAVAAALISARRGSQPPVVAAVSEAQAREWRRLVDVDTVFRPGLPLGSIPWSGGAGAGLLFAGRLSPEKVPWRRSPSPGAPGCRSFFAGSRTTRRTPACSSPSAMILGCGCWDRCHGPGCGQRWRRPQPCSARRGGRSPSVW
jgi:hypothetical protein